jgi:3-oxoacyl-[acyl-carrier protein] reductase
LELGIIGKLAVVSAASKGLGKAVAAALAAEGVNILMFSRRKEAIEAAAHEISRSSGNGAKVHALAADVTDPGDLERVMEHARTEFGGVDILYSNAGGPKPGTFEQLAESDWDHAVQDCLLSAVRMTRQALPHMRQKRWGRIVSGTSFSVKQPAALLMLSNAVRSATTAWSKTLADEVGRDGITVNTIAPGLFDTDRVKGFEENMRQRTGRSVDDIRAERLVPVALGRYGRPEELAAAVAFLASERASYITGVTLLVDGGLVRATY